MNVVMEEGWKSVLKDEFEKEYFVIQNSDYISACEAYIQRFRHLPVR